MILFDSSQNRYIVLSFPRSSLFMPSPTTTAINTIPRTALFTEKVEIMLLGIIFKITFNGLLPVVPEEMLIPSMVALNTPALKNTIPNIEARTSAIPLVSMNQPMVFAETRPRVDASLISLIAKTIELKTIGTIISFSARMKSCPPE